MPLIDSQARKRMETAFKASRLIPSGCEAFMVSLSERLANNYPQLQALIVKNPEEALEAAWELTKAAGIAGITAHVLHAIPAAGITVAGTIVIAKWIVALAVVAIAAYLLYKRVKAFENVVDRLWAEVVRMSGIDATLGQHDVQRALGGAGQGIRRTVA